MKSRDSILIIICSLAVISMLYPFLRREEERKELNECCGNVRVVARALDSYSADHDGHYPNELGMLVPEYLQQLPRCSVSGTVTYQMDTGPRASRNTRDLQDYYYVYCAGENHLDAGVPPNHPGLESTAPVCLK